MFGVIGDRIGHRDLLAMMRATYAVLATVLTTLVLSAISRRFMLLFVAALMGIVRLRPWRPWRAGRSIMPHDQLIGAISIPEPR